MGHNEKHVGLVSVELEEQVRDGLGGGGVETAGGLITEQQSRAVDQGSRNGHSLSLAAREFCRSMLEAMRQTYSLQQVLTPGGGVIVTNGKRHGRQKDILEHRILGQKMRILKNEADRRVAKSSQLTLVQARGVDSMDVDRSRRCGIEGAHDMQESALARSRRTGENEGFIGPKIEGGSLQDFYEGGAERETLVNVLDEEALGGGI